MPVKVSVVVPVYNPGPYIEDCIAGLLRQSLPAAEFEAIFVDDGSTDATPERLDALAAEHDNITVVHQENSGWSGKPRNVGIDRARGEYVFFADNDDWLGDQALERLYAFAKKNDSDLVVGKMAGKGRGVPRELFRRNHDKATLETAPLIDSLTPHKLFRKAFLDKHDLRFPEGRRRLEDHVFVTEAYFLADTISVLSDYVCYYHVRRDDSSNAGFQQLEPVGYFGNLGEALDIVERHTEPGTLRDRLYRRWYRNEMIERLRGSRLVGQPADFQRALFAEIRKVALERFGPGVAAGLAPAQRVVSALIHADRLDELVRLAEWEATIRSRGRLEDLAWHSGALLLTVTADLLAGETPMGFVRKGDRDLLDPPLSAEALASVSADDLDVTSRLPKTAVDVLVRSRESAAEFYLPTSLALSRTGRDEGPFSLVLRSESRIDPSVAASGSPLVRGIWDVVIRVGCVGWTKESRLGSVRSDGATLHRLPAVVGTAARVCAPYWTGPHGNLSLDVGQKTRRVEQDLRPVGTPSLVVEESWVELSLRLRLLTASAGADAAVELVLDDQAVAGPASLTPVSDTESLLVARLPRSGLVAGRWQLKARFVPTSRGSFAEFPVVLTIPADDGTPTVSVTGAAKAPVEPDQVPSPPLSFARRLARRVPVLRAFYRRLQRAVAPSRRG